MAEWTTVVGRNRSLWLKGDRLSSKPDGQLIDRESNSASRPHGKRHLQTDTASISSMSAASSAEGDDSSVTHDSALQRVQIAIEAMRGSELVTHAYSQMHDKLPASIGACITLGVGSFSRSGTALLQLAFIVSLLERVRGDSEIKAEPGEEPRRVDTGAVIFDPLFTAVEISVCEALGFQASVDNLKGRHSCETCTLFFLPHCPYQIYSNVLYSNWDQLDRILLIGNR